MSRQPCFYRLVILKVCVLFTYLGVGQPLFFFIYYIIIYLCPILIIFNSNCKEREAKYTQTLVNYFYDILVMRKIWYVQLHLPEKKEMTSLS